MLEQLRTRRSIRAYTGQKLEPEVVQAFREVLLRSPSSRGINPWEFIFVENRNTLEALAKSKMHGSSFLDKAALGVVICADTIQSDVWVEDCSIAAILLQLEVHDRGLGSCWIQIRNRMHDNETTSEEYIRKLLCIPQNMGIHSIISIGFPAEKLAPIPFEDLDQSKIHQNGW